MNNTHRRDPRSKKAANTASRGSSDKARNAKQRYEHYLALAREKALSGEWIEAENYYQHAEHYFRSATAANANMRPAVEQR